MLLAGILANSEGASGALAVGWRQFRSGRGNGHRVGHKFQTERKAVAGLCVSTPLPFTPGRLVLPCVSPIVQTKCFPIFFS